MCRVTHIKSHTCDYTEYYPHTGIEEADGPTGKAVIGGHKVDPDRVFRDERESLCYNRAGRRGLEYTSLCHRGDPPKHHLNRLQPERTAHVLSRLKHVERLRYQET